MLMDIEIPRAQIRMLLARAGELSEENFSRPGGSLADTLAGPDTIGQWRLRGSLMDQQRGGSRSVWRRWLAERNDIAVGTSNGTIIMAQTIAVSIDSFVR